MKLGFLEGLGVLEISEIVEKRMVLIIDNSKQIHLMNSEMTEYLI